MPDDFVDDNGQKWRKTKTGGVIRLGSVKGTSYGNKRSKLIDAARSLLTSEYIDPQTGVPSGQTNEEVLVALMFRFALRDPVTYQIFFSFFMQVGLRDDTQVQKRADLLDSRRYAEEAASKSLGVGSLEVFAISDDEADDLYAKYLQTGVTAGGQSA